MTAVEKLTAFLEWLNGKGCIDTRRAAAEDFEDIAQSYLEQAGLAEEGPDYSLMDQAVNRALQEHGFSDRLEQMEKDLARYVVLPVEVEIMDTQKYGKYGSKGEEIQYLLRLDGELYRATRYGWGSDGPGSVIRSRPDTIGLPNRGRTSGLLDNGEIDL